jgi:hypothetical protein
MDLDTQADLGGRVIVVRGVGPASKSDWLTEFDQAACQVRKGGAAALLMDLRDRGFTPSATYANALVDALAGLGSAVNPPVALLTNPGLQYGGARMLCLLGELRGCVAAAFHDEFAAWAWLREQLGQQARNVPAPPQLAMEA